MPFTRFFVRTSIYKTYRECLPGPRLILVNFKNFRVPKVCFYQSIPLEIPELCYANNRSTLYYSVFGREEFPYKRTDLLSIKMLFVNNGIMKILFTSSREMVVTTNPFNVTCYLLTLKKVVIMKHLYKNATFYEYLTPVEDDRWFPRSKSC